MSNNKLIMNFHAKKNTIIMKIAKLSVLFSHGFILGPLLTTGNAKFSYNDCINF
jgi:hypothetical protein